MVSVLIALTSEVFYSLQTESALLVVDLNPFTGSTSLRGLCSHLCGLSGPLYPDRGNPSALYTECVHVHTNILYTYYWISLVIRNLSGRVKRIIPISFIWKKDTNPKNTARYSAYLLHVDGLLCFLWFLKTTAIKFQRRRSKTRCCFCSGGKMLKTFVVDVEKLFLSTDKS